MLLATQLSLLAMTRRASAFDSMGVDDAIVAAGIVGSLTGGFRRAPR